MGINLILKRNSGTTFYVQAFLSFVLKTSKENIFDTSSRFRFHFFYIYIYATGSYNSIKNSQYQEIGYISQVKKLGNDS